MRLTASLMLTFIITIMGFTSSFAQAQRDVVRNIFFDTLRTGDVRVTTVGVDDMKYIGNQYINQDDSTYMNSVTAVVRRDVDFYADFELVLVDSFYLEVYEIIDLDPLGWMRLGADYLVKLEAEFPGRNLRVRWRLFDTARRQQFAKGTVEMDKVHWRQLGHEIANEIVHTMTGEDGIFLTKIVYARKIGSAKELFIADYDGANERQLTNNGSINISPTFSHDGKSVFYTSYTGGDPHLYRINIESGQSVLVADYPGIVAAPAVSPDGNKIACVLTRDGNSEIYLLEPNGKIIKRLTRHRAIDTAPTWSPDGQLIAFSSDRTGRPQVYIMDILGLNLRRITWEGSYNDSPIWSQRGDRLTFVSRSRSRRFDLASIDTSGTDYRVLTEVGMNENPHFSPDGKHIIFSSDRLGPRDIFTMDISGRNQRRLTRHGRCSNPTWGPLP